MTSMSFKGKEYKTDDLLRECVLMSQELADRAKLNTPLPADTDLTEANLQKVKEQLSGIQILPKTILSAFWGSFVANHIKSLSSAIRSVDPSTQRNATATYILIMSLIPDPKENSYFRRFLLQLRDNLPTVIAQTFVQGVDWKRPGGPGYICTLIIHMLFWCDTSLGDDKNASIDASVRIALLAKLNELQSINSYAKFERHQQVEIERLAGILAVINSEKIPGNTYLVSTRQHLEGQVDFCGNENCFEEALMTCSKCKSVRYCGKSCQQRDWKKGHKLKCFTVNF